MAFSQKDFPRWEGERWQDAAENPVIGYFETPEAGYAIGDPQILVPGQSDEEWHAFYHGFYKDFQPFYHHLVSGDGVKWRLRSKWPWRVNPSFLFHDGEEWVFYFTGIADREQQARYGADNFIFARTTRDFEVWSQPEVLLLPELPWEREYDPVGYRAVAVRNPCMVKLGEGRYRLYYSAGTVKLDKCGYEEPKYISFAEGPTPLGPFVRHGQPILGPDPAVPHRNLGAGAIKVFGWGEEFVALYNSIYQDDGGYQHSAINVLRSADGIAWEEAPYNPILAPTGDGGWKSAFVYQLDLVRSGGGLRLYYNGRDKWQDGIEQIGFSVLPEDGSPVRKLWDLEEK